MSVLVRPTSLATCSYQRAIEGLRSLPEFDDSDAAVIQLWSTGEVSANQAAKSLRALGFRTSATTLKDHRRGECICGVAS